MFSEKFFLATLVVVFVGMVGFQLLGHRVGARRLEGGPGGFGEGTTAVEGSLYALLGLLVAFTFSGADERFSARRAQIVEEANAVGTAYLRLDLLPKATRPRLRELFRAYLDARLAFYEKLPDRNAAWPDHVRATQLQNRIWTDSLDAAALSPDTRATLLLVPALNAMFDITVTRDAALLTHEPTAIFLLLILLSFVCAFFGGLGMAKNPRPSRVHIIVFSLAMAVTAYVILNLEYPRAGFIHLKKIDAVLLNARAAME
jgi:hypothetical protein